jgi:aquaporin related protein
MFTILMLAAERSKNTFVAPIGIDLSLFVVQIAGVNYSGSSVNPARSFGPCVASANFSEYHSIYWLRPMMGAIVAAGFYHFIKVFANVMILRDVL